MNRTPYIAVKLNSLTNLISSVASWPCLTNVLTIGYVLKYNETLKFTQVVAAVLTAVARRPVVSALKWIFDRLTWTAVLVTVCSSDLNHLLMALTPQAGLFYHPVSCQSKAEILTSVSLFPWLPKSPGGPSTCRCLSSSPTPLAWLGKRVCPFVHSHPHGRRVTTHSNTVPTCVYS